MCADTIILFLEHYLQRLQQDSTGLGVGDRLNAGEVKEELGALLDLAGWQEGGGKVYYDLKKDDRLRLRQTEPVVAVLVGGRAG